MTKVVAPMSSAEGMICTSGSMPKVTPTASASMLVATAMMNRVFRSTLSPRPSSSSSPPLTTSKIILAPRKASRAKAIK